MLRIVEQAWRSDVGRQRDVNEDDLVVRAPFFAVADGMGGAKAGEVASAIATRAFDGEADSGEPAQAQLTRILREANRRIYELAVRDASRRGMGTTLTAAKVHGDEITLAHVGDSRAYVLRRGELEQLTTDHSLVAELERSGQISPEAAEHHPQRSIITRALGPEPDVEVDTYTVAGRDGDVFLLCSDGLTSMVSDEEVASILRSVDSLEDTAEALVRAANQGGGRDNITVVLFRLGADVTAGADDAETMAGGLRAEDVRAAAADAPTPARAGVAGSPVASGLRDGPADATAVRGAERRSARAPRRRRRRVRAAARVVVGLGLVAAAIGGLYALSRHVYFVGTNDAGLVTLYRGLPYELPFGVDLYREEYASGVPARAIPASRREHVLDHEWRSREDAADLVRALERGELDGGAGSRTREASP
ncbi:MAG: Stp1/IreP family PP2C-type Ser/Thr phosphatase [Thermoleophilaceae bacterium]|nr:Stp1/IreP family PP2C-type Ser/Thr phosphatase [Thermoleophilaceae bacterium]